MSERKDDAADRLARLLYGRAATARDLVMGSDAHILRDAANEIQKLRDQIELMQIEAEEREEMNEMGKVAP